MNINPKTGGYFYPTIIILNFEIYEIYK